MEYQHQTTADENHLDDGFDGSTGGSSINIPREVGGLSLPHLVNQNSVVRNNT